MKRFNEVGKRGFLFFIGVCLMTIHGVYAQNTVNDTCVPEINFPGGRIAMSFDGNQHDPDDVGALPMSLAFTWAAGLQDKVTIVEHSNHICDVNNVLHEKMQESAAGVIERFGYDANRIFDFYSDPDAATDAFVAEINKSTANNPLWIIGGGPMESIWRAVSQSDKSALSNVSVISHSIWNQEHGDCGDDSHNWEDLRAFEENGLTLIEITNQNSSNGDDDFNTPREKWDWLRDNEDANLAWIHSRDQFDTGSFVKFDPSDSGMVYWLITGGPNGGNEKGGPTEAQNLLENPCSGQTNEDKPMIALKIPSGDQVLPLDYDLNVEVELNDPNGIAKAEIFINDNPLRAERVPPYEWGHDGSSNPEELNGLPIGEHEIKIIGTDNTGATNEVSFMLNVVEVLSTSTIGSENSSFVVYPNPSSSGAFTFSEKAKWELFTAHGAKVLEGNSSTIAADNLSTGLYFLKARIGASEDVLQLLVR